MITSYVYRYATLFLLCASAVMLPMQEPSAQQKQAPQINITDPKSPFNEPIDKAQRRVSCMVASVMGTLGGALLGWVVGKMIGPTNAWWTTQDRNTLITKTCAVMGGTITAKVVSNKYADIRKELNQTTFLESIENDDVKQIERWLEDEWLLIKTGLRRKSILTWQDSQGRTPLMLAVIHGSYNVAECLLKKGAGLDNHINTIDNQGRTALHWAAAAPCYVIAALLLKYGADKSIKDKNGNIPSMLVPENYESLSRLLLSPFKSQTAQTQAQEPKPWTRGQTLGVCGGILFLLLLSRAK